MTASILAWEMWQRLRYARRGQTMTIGKNGHDELAALMAEAETPAGAAALFAVLYSELHRLAQRQLARAGAITLGTTTLLHEAYLNMAERAGASFPDRGRFMGYVARVMRSFIIDYVRGRKAQKRGGQFELAPLGEEVADPGLAPELERIGDAIDALAALDAELARIVDLKFFCGFSFAEIAAMRGLSERTVQRHWDKARLYLHRALGHSPAL
ncbi:MAG TPA: ECF-type sigma factor [Vicinamibacteria bacterium]|jgi:RNA polymerase sigma factor (TIGR02999 family)